MSTAILTSIIKPKPTRSSSFPQLHNLLSPILSASTSWETLNRRLAEMQNSRIPPFTESKRKKIHNPKQQPLTQLQSRISKKASSRIKPEQVHAMSHQHEMFSSDSSEYRALRRNYLLLEEESFALERELKEVEDEVRALEDEKDELLDKLVVMEGLVDP